MHFRLSTFIIEANSMISKKKKFDLGSYCLQCRLPKYISNEKVGKGLKNKLNLSFLVNCLLGIHFT